jgi:hypothetical protein
MHHAHITTTLARSVARSTRNCSSLLTSCCNLKMLRSLVQPPALRTASSSFSRRVLSTTRTPLFSSSSLSKRAAAPISQNLTARSLSNKTDQQAKKEGASEDGSDTKEIVMTPGEQVAAVSRLSLWAGISVFAGFCAFFIGKELLPT